MTRWAFWIDRGGTFTDVVARDPAGALHLKKLLSEDPSQLEDAPLRAIRELLGQAPDEPLDAARIDSVRMGTTVATNALLERRGARVCLVVTAGFEDALEIGTQARPDLFALAIRKPEPLVAEVIGLEERVLVDGAVRRAPDLAALRARLEGVRARGVDAVAVVLMNAWAYPAHERAVGALCREMGFGHVGLSHDVVNEIKLTARGDTTTADAYLTPILRAYVERVRRRVGDQVSLRFMQSSGGLADASAFSGKDAVLSGPAGGVVAVAHAARQAGLPKVIGFDMGGTSTDVTRVDVDEGFERTYERVVAGVRLKAPMLAVSTIAAGGGSLLRFDGRRLTVGPESAGAVPGPVCYRRAEGRLAVTDANAVLGRVQARWFPACFGERGDEPLDVEAARARMAELAAEVGRATGRELSAVELAAGFVRIANDAMARAIREISVARGYDVTEYALFSFGGAGAQHACAMAETLGIRTVLLHPLAGVLSAWGMGLADVVHADVAAVLRRLDEVAPATLEAAFAALEARGRAAVEAQGLRPERVRCARSLDLRYVGVDATLNVAADPAWTRGEGFPPALLEAFAAQHRQLYGFDRPGHPIEVVNVRVEAIGASAQDAAWPAPGAREGGGAPRPADRALVAFDRLGHDGVRRVEQVDTPIYRRADLGPGDRLDGPALVAEAASTIVVDPGWSARMDAHGNLLLERTGAAPRRERLGTERDPVLLEIMANLFMSIAEQMGRTLERVSLSVNMKERLDFSCAIFDKTGGLVANAPHIPVHLGAMGESVRAVMTARKDDLRPGDVIVTNDPYRGGSHLPDVTVITPVFVGGRLTFWAASRGHHADIGGVVPGSMPPFSRSIEEEGVRLHDLLAVRDGRLREAEVRAALSSGPWPARNLDERLADLEAQIAANAAGVRLLQEMVERYEGDGGAPEQDASWPRGAEGEPLDERPGVPARPASGLRRTHHTGAVQAYMGHVQDDAAEALREALRALGPRTSTFEDWLDDGARVRVTLTVTEDGRAKVDFTGTDPRLPGNLNAPRAVVRAAVLYVFRTLIARPIPLNEGCFAPLEVVIPEGSLLDPQPPDAVVGGNVETSQRLCDVLYGALGKLAASQGTMNNLTFGTESFGYYETIGGGAAAGLGFDGASAVHTHMTNTRITDPEVLERRYPVVVRRFALRRGSGGQGVYRGGDGVVRALEFTAPLTAAVLSERRALGPFGLHGAGSGAPGRNRLHRGAGGRGPYGHREVRDLPGKVRVEVTPGDVLEVETPGGGGYDPTPTEWAAMAPEEARRLFREGRWRGPTSGIAMRHVQANMVVLPADLADAFEAYCRKNPRPCPLLERLPRGFPRTRALAAAADLRRDLPRYRVYEGPQAAWREVDDLVDLWEPDDVAFLLGCSFSLEQALLAAGLPVRHMEENKNVPMYLTRRETEPVAPFGGRLVVSMRPLPEALVDRARAATERHGFAHGAPVHAGDPAALGIKDLARPEWGDAVTLRPGEVPVFWACGVTSQVALLDALRRGDLDRALTHAPGHMFIGDATNEELLGRGDLPLV